MNTEMTAQEIIDFLENQRTVIVATTRKSGSPVMHAVWFVYLDNAIYINIQRSSFKMKNILRDNRVCALVEDGESYFELRGVMIEGEANEELIQFLAELLDLLLGHSFPSPAKSGPEATPARASWNSGIDFRVSMSMQRFPRPRPQAGHDRASGLFASIAEARSARAFAHSSSQIRYGKRFRSPNG